MSADRLGQSGPQRARSVTMFHSISRILLTALARIAAVLVMLLGAYAVENGPGYRFWPLQVPGSGRTGFTLCTAAATGIDFTNRLSLERSMTNHVLLNGSGVAAGDVDGDGLADLYFCGLDSDNRLYRNLGGWKFQDVTEVAGVACPKLDATGALMADIDGDADLDLVVNSIAGGTRVFVNDGQGRFQPSPAAPVLNPDRAGTSLAMADMDGDGALDLYVTNYRPMFFFLDKPETRYSVRMVDGAPKVTMIDGRPLTDPEFTNRFVFQVHMAAGKVTLAKEEVGQVDVLYRNNGRGGFSPVPFTGGAFQNEDGTVLTEPPRDWGLSVMFRDLNSDNAPDLYICNDFRGPDRIWINDGRGRFRALPGTAIRQMCLSAMGMDVADVNRDGHFDLFVADMLSTEHGKRLTQRIDIRPEVLVAGQITNRPQFSRNMLQLSRGDGTFAEVAQLCGLEASEWTWSPVFLDADLDGWEDLLVSNGFERDTMNVDAQRRFDSMSHQQKLTGLERLKLRRFYPRLATPDLAFRNQGDGTFADVSAAWGFDTPGISQGMCLADLDNDGDLDLAVNNMNGPAGLYRNETAAPRVAVRLKGLPPNTRGIGAKIELLGGPVHQSQEMISGGRYCSSDDAIRTFAAGASGRPLTLIVTWRSGKRSVIEGVAPNRMYEIDEAASQQLAQTPQPAASANGAWLSAARDAAPNAAPPPAFRDVSERLRHVHHEAAFDDFERQPLLPMKLSQAGPGVAWFDLDGDGWEDLMVGTGRGGKLALFRNDTQGGFQPLPGVPSAPADRDQTSILGWHPSAGRTGVLVGASSYEDAQRTPGSVLQWAPGGKAFEEAVSGSASSTGVLLLSDVDGDADLDLFVGGRSIPGRYPEPASSRLLRNDGGVFKDDPADTNLFERIGLVTGGVFSDLDNDGDPDLVLACEWGPLRVFTNEAGKFTEATRSLGLDSFRGWWNGVNTGDFDGDGRLDIVASNWGRNSRYERARSQPLRLVYGDFVGDGGVHMLEAFVEPHSKKTVPWRRLDDVARALPFVQAAFETFESFSRAGIEQILGDRFAKAATLEANWLESTVFFNRGGRFEPVTLPLEAQLAPAFAVCVGDLDGDGAEDVFLSQNFFAVQTEMSRLDAGRGLWLRGNGRGKLQAVGGKESGLLIYGEQRGAALSDYDADGRTDLVVTQNAAETRLFHNVTARPGLRVRLKGPAANPEGFGAQLRLITTDGPGPVREIHGGAGYWSQDGAVQVMAAAGPANAIEVRWPWSKAIPLPIPEGAREIEIDSAGQLRKAR